MDNCVLATSKLLTLIGVPNTKQNLKEKILTHGEYPSLLSIADTLDDYNVNSAAFKINRERFDDLTTPCIVQVFKEGTPFFYLLKSISGDDISYYDNTGKLFKGPKEAFLKLWTGICLLAEKTEKSKELGIEKTKKTKRLFFLLTSISLALLLVKISYTTFVPSEVSHQTIYPFTIILFTITKAIGLTTGLLLLWYEIDKYNPVLQNICSTGKKANCTAVLNSKHSKIFDGNLSLSIVAFAYFLATIFILIFGGYTLPNFSSVILLSYLSFPIILFSFFYQAFYLKQWCRLCVGVQIVLMAEIILGIVFKLHSGKPSLEVLLSVAIIFLLTIISWNPLKGLLLVKKEIVFEKRKVNKVLSNPSVFASLLNNSKEIQTLPKGLGIHLVNETSNFSLIKICSPYCNPCAKAHPILEKLIESGRISLQIVFKSNKASAHIVEHLLAINQEYDKEKVRMALDYWYSSSTKDYKSFATKFPVTTNQLNFKSEIEAMNNWCKSEEITYTPTIFINGHEFPKEYPVKDLLQVLT